MDEIEPIIRSAVFLAPDQVVFFPEVLVVDLPFFDLFLCGRIELDDCRREFNDPFPGRRLFRRMISILAPSWRNGF